MPKERRERSVSFDRWTSPYSTSSSHVRRSTPKIPSESKENIKEWEEARCPVCMEHPHNAVLLICSSHEKGCRPFMCDTSYRHSNCLDQFRKSFEKASSTSIEPEGNVVETTNISSMVTSSTDFPNELTESPSPSGAVPSDEKLETKLVCPLCRGHVKEWVVVEAARSFMNSKLRSCACETCDFSGIYKDLRKHARRVHPLVRPSEADPERERNWRRMERQRDLGDLLSTLQSSFGEERSIDESSIFPMDDGSWLTVFFLIRVFRPGSGPRSSSWHGTSRSRGQLRFRRRSTRLWGETHDVETGSSSRDEEDDSSDDGSEMPPPVSRRERSRRRTTPDVL